MRALSQLSLGCLGVGIATFLAAACGPLTPHKKAPSPDPEAPQGQETHGGDRIASVFVAKGYRVFDFLLSLKGDDMLLNEEEIQSFLLALKETRVDPVNGPFVDSDGDTVDARVLEDPLITGRKVIQLDRARWEDAFATGADVYRLVFHEYLWVIGADDRNYRISNRLMLFDRPLGGDGNWKAMKDDGAPLVDTSRIGIDLEVVSTAGRLAVLQSDGASCRGTTVASYDCATDAWRTLDVQGAPSIGSGFLAASVNEHLFAWSGVCTNDTSDLRVSHLDSGFLLDIAAGTWVAVNSKGAPEGRRRAVVVGVDTGVFVWGGIGEKGRTGDGAIYQLGSSSWQPIAEEGAPAIGTYRGVWVPVGRGPLGGKVVLWDTGLATCTPHAATYDPKADAWGTLEAKNAPAYPCAWDKAVWVDGTLAFLFEFPQQHPDGRSVAGTLWNVGDDRWTDIPATGAPEYRAQPSVTAGKDTLLVFGGKDIDGLSLNTGKIYYLGAKSWHPMRSDAAPLARSAHVAAWNGRSLVIWGGQSILDRPMRTGGVFTPDF